ncbi:MAG: hypothetical protein A2029_11035 [Chloroflexi bacterium RBG_19FT_COMBO_47_9]|nr:MAG: hypothetical protein A2029_11035 [Chloroflexi bacterium RBG_19FT_COMBO_47_9]
MSETITPPTQTLPGPLLKWVPVFVIKPRRIFENISTPNRRLWLAPMLILTITLLGNVMVSGWLKQQTASISEESLPPDFQYYSPEQQAQYMQAMQVTQGPVFVYVLPAITSILGLWVAWLAIGGLLHLITTLFGGRGDMSTSLNIVAWSSLPLALRDIVRIVAMIISRQLISHPGISGFAPLSESGWNILLGQILGLIDIYIIWVICLVIFGIRLTSNLSLGKAIISGLVSIFIVLLLRALIGLASAQLGGLNVIRPFFF